MDTPTKVEKRTARQNNSLHLFFSLASEALNDAGYDIQKTIRHQMDIPWQKDSFKDLIWRQAQKVYLGKQSTKDLDKQKDIDAVYEIVNRYLGSLGIHVDFPSNELSP